MTATRAQRKRMRRWVRAMRKAGCTVKWRRGWGRRGRPVGAFDPRGWMLHHDATAKGFSPGVLPLLENGRADLPGPLCHFWLGKDGVWRVIAAGRANHGGHGTWPQPWLRTNNANADLIGVEIDLTVGETMSDEQQNALMRGVAAVCILEGWAVSRVVGHKEYQPGKVDPAFDMRWARKRIARRKLALIDHRPWFTKRS